MAEDKLWSKNHWSNLAEAGLSALAQGGACDGIVLALLDWPLIIDVMAAARAAVKFGSAVIALTVSIRDDCGALY